MRIKEMLMMGTLGVALLSCSEQPVVEASYDIIPVPLEVSSSDAAPFTITKKTVVAYPAGNDLLRRDAEFLSEYLAQTTGYALATKEYSGEAPSKAIVLALDETIANEEGYKLSVSESQVVLKGKTAAGVFYGVQTIRKSAPAVATGAAIQLPAAEITDEPCFGYRGMHLDVCRHFFDMDFIKKYIDLLALHNMNAFHWHLTEDQGWRIEMKNHPELTEIGAYRDQTLIGHYDPNGEQKYDGKRYGGFYTQEQAKEIVAYAAERYITVIPEIDLPGHMLGALATYPSLGCTGGPYKVAETWGVFPDVLCAGNEDAMLFLESVLDEVCEIFPSKYIHIGGDESPRDRWKVCPKCQAKARELGLKADEKHSVEDRLQSYVMSRMEKHLNAKGRSIIGWDEILEGDVAPNATVMSWRGIEGGIVASNLGHDVIMTPTTYCYLDYYQLKNREGERLCIGGYLPVEKTYSFNPTDGLDEKAASHILGVQGNVWTEYIDTPDFVEYQAIPRLDAITEIQWMPNEKRNFDEFAARFKKMAEFYDRDNYSYCKQILNGPEPEEPAKAE